VTDALGSWSVPAELAGDIVLAASELVTNAVEHGSSEITVELRLAGGCILLKVRDDSGEAPVLRRPNPHSPRGRGLALIAAISAAWGHQHAEGGKWVWAEFRLDG
jgi:anti-sigma regulatory factor (Ser/Thr protein kinase)